MCNIQKICASFGVLFCLRVLHHQTRVYIVYTILHGWFWTLYYVCKNWRRLKMFVCLKQVVPKRQHDRKLKLRPVLSYIQSNLNKILIRFICVSSSCHDHLTRIIFNQEKIHHFFCTYMNETPGYREFLYCFFDLLLCKFSGVWKGLKIKNYNRFKFNRDYLSSINIISFHTNFNYWWMNQLMFIWVKSLNDFNLIHRLFDIVIDAQMLLVD